VQQTKDVTWGRCSAVLNHVGDGGGFSVGVFCSRNEAPCLFVLFTDGTNSAMEQIPDIGKEEIV